MTIWTEGAKKGRRGNDSRSRAERNRGGPKGTKTETEGYKRDWGCKHGINDYRCLLPATCFRFWILSDLIINLGHNLGCGSKEKAKQNVCLVPLWSEPVNSRFVAAGPATPA